MTIKLYWSRGSGAEDLSRQNFGDYLSPLIVEMVSGQRVEYAPVKSADLMAIGTILTRLRKVRRFLSGQRIHIWGSGTDSPFRRFSGRHYYHAVRGVKSLEQIKSFRGKPAFGDPGLLADEWWSGRPRPQKKFLWGLVPHFVDQSDPRVKDVIKVQGVKLINVFDPVEIVLREIQECRFILSSSMHGLIVADAFGIPNRRIVFSKGIISETKFVDYYSAFGIDSPAPLEPERFIESGGLRSLFNDLYLRPGLDDIKQGLINSFPFA